MAAYNSVNGHTMTESPMLNDILKGEWGFDGVVVSDWRAARTIAAASAGLDLVMPGPSGPWGPALVEAVRQGLVSEAAIDDKVAPAAPAGGTRRSPALAHVAEPTSQAGPEPDQADGPDRPEAHRPRSRGPTSAPARRCAPRRPLASCSPATSNSLLPLDPRSLRRVAVLGPNAAVPRTLGGGSATVFPPYRVSPLDGLRAALEPGVVVDYSPGVRSHTRIPLARPALLHLPGSS